MSRTVATPVLLYDGACGLCAGSVQFVLRHEPPTRRDRLRFAPLQGQFAEEIRRAHPRALEVDSVVWYEPQAGGASRILLRSDAALEVLRHVGGGWGLLAMLFRLVPRVVRDTVYDQVARRRLSLVSPACLLPDAASRHRFLS